MTYGTWLRLWAKELWVNLTASPWRVVPHSCKPLTYGKGATRYHCTRCGSSSARVQRKGQRQAVSLRRRLS